MRRFFIDQDQIENQLTLTGSEAHHICRVLRLRPGQEIELFNSRGDCFTAVLLSCSGGRAKCRILSRRPIGMVEESGVILAQCVLKREKMDLLVQKATELGVDRFQPVLSSHARRLSSLSGTLQRWHRIMIAACKQCGRNHPMRISSPVDLADLDTLSSGLRVMLWERERDRSLAGLGLDSSPLCLLVGPEGGFSATDLSITQDAGFTRVGMGQVTLRAETAALAALAILLFQRGHFG